MLEDEVQMMKAFTAYLDTAASKEENQERRLKLENCIRTMEDLYSLQNYAHVAPPTSSSLLDIYKSGRQVLNEKRPRGAENTEREDVAFNSFLKKLKTETAFFANTVEGSAEYKRRVAKARSKFEYKSDQKTSREIPVSTKPQSNMKIPSALDKQQAEELKASGNVALKSKKFKEAHDLYTKCIKLDPHNAIYYSNRAAASNHLGLLIEMVEDCQKAIELDANFARPWDRLALAYNKLDMLEEEVFALRNATHMSPNKEDLALRLKMAEAKLNGEDPGLIQSSTRSVGNESSLSQSQPNPAMGNGMPPNMPMPGPDLFSNVARAFGNQVSEDDIRGIVGSNPQEIMQNAARFMQTPEAAAFLNSPQARDMMGQIGRNMPDLGNVDLSSLLNSFGNAGNNG